MYDLIVFEDHFGERTHTTPYIGQLSTIRDARTLNCQFSQIQACCWYNMPKPMDDLDWVIVNTTVEKVRFWGAYGGKTIRIPGTNQSDYSTVVELDYHGSNI